MRQGRRSLSFVTDGDDFRGLRGGSGDEEQFYGCELYVGGKPGKV